MNRRSRRLARWLPAAGWMVFIFVLSDRPGLRVSDDAAVDAPLRALAHVGVYAVLGAAMLYGLGGPGPGPGARRRGLAAVMLAALFGLSDEAHQSFVPERTAQLEDLLLDALGAATGVVLATALAARWHGRALEAEEGTGPADPA